MALTRLQMATEVLDNLSRAASGKTRSDTSLSTRVVVWLNRSQRIISRRYDFLFKESTATTLASQKSYAFPSNIRSLFSIRLENGTLSRKLECVMPWEFDIAVPKADVYNTYQPFFYVPYKQSNTFELFHIPDQAYTLRMRHSIWPTDLSTDSQTSDYAASNIDLDDIIIQFSTAEGYRWLQEWEDAKAWSQIGYTNLKEAYRAECDSFPDWAPRGGSPSVSSVYLSGEYHNNPFIMESP